jgi:hypothetical protein
MESTLLGPIRADALDPFNPLLIALDLPFMSFLFPEFRRGRERSLSGIDTGSAAGPSSAGRSSCVCPGSERPRRLDTDSP